MIELLSYSFFRNAVLGVLLVAIGAGMVGTYIMTRRMVFLSGGITHACFGGLGLGYMLGWNPIACAAVFAVAGSLGVDAMDRRMNVRNDSAIAVIWALGMALGTLFVFLTNGYVPELNSFLFGNVLTITPTDLWLFLAFAIVLGVFYVAFYPYIVAISFDPDFARTRGLPVTLVNTCMTVFTALGIVLTIKMIGIMLLMSMMTIPQMTVELFSSRYSRLLWLSVILSAVGCLAGLAIAYAIDVPASATIVLVLIIFYLLARLVKR